MLDDITKTPADRRTSLEICAGLVRAHQQELLRAAYLQTGDAERAERLAEAAFLAVLPELLRDEHEIDIRDALLRALAARYLADPRGGGARVPGAKAEQARYQVDDERARLWAALERCDPPQRLALVLRDFARLDEISTGELTRWPPAELRTRLETARQRLRDAAGARGEQPTHALLLTLAFDAPQVDLWEQLEQPLRRLALREQRRRHIWTGGLLAGLTLAVLAGALWLGGWFTGEGGPTQRAGAIAIATLDTTTPTAPPLTATPTPAAPLAGVPDLHLLSATVDGVRQTLLTDSAPTVLATLDGAPEHTAVSPDGRHLVYTRVEGFGNAERSSLVAIDTATAAVLWELELAGSSGPPALTNDQVVIVEAGPSRARAPRLVAYDLADGRELARWTLEPHPVIGRWARTDELHIFPSTDGGSLTIVTVQVDPVAGLAVRTVLRYRPPDATLESVAQEELNILRGRWGPAFDFENARRTPDGGALYSLSADEVSAVLRFFDLETAAVTSVELPMTAAFTGARWEQAGSVRSHDGRWLYLVAQTGDVLGIDLIERRLARRFPLDLNGVAPQPPGGAQWSWGWEAGVFSLDGGRLYLLHAFAGSSVANDPDAMTVLWEIDVAQWQVLKEWRIPGLVETLTLDAGTGRPLMTARRAELEHAGSVTALYRLDTAGGQLVELSRPFGAAADVPAFELLSVRSLFSMQQGRTPAADGVVPQDAPDSAALPLLDLAVERPVLAAGDQAVFQLRLLDPAGLSPARAGASGVRLDPEAAVTLTLALPEQAELVVFPTEIEPGVYRAGLPLEAVGSWTLTATVRYGDGTAWSEQWANAVQVNPSFRADDGRPYTLRFTLGPATPVVGEEALITAMFIDAETGLQLPAGVTPETGLPDEIDVLFRREDGAFKTVTLLPAGHGAYSASSSFRWAGFWPAELSYRTSEGLVTLPAGTFQVTANVP